MHRIAMRRAVFTSAKTADAETLKSQRRDAEAQRKTNSGLKPRLGTEREAATCSCFTLVLLCFSPRLCASASKSFFK